MKQQTSLKSILILMHLQCDITVSSFLIAHQHIIGYSVPCVILQFLSTAQQ